MTADFDHWLTVVFDHPVGEPEWFWASGFDEQWEPLGVVGPVTVSYLTRLYGNAAVLRRFLLEQVAQGIWFLVGESSPAQPSHSLLDASIPIEARVACIKAMASSSSASSSRRRLQAPQTQMWTRSMLRATCGGTCSRHGAVRLLLSLKLTRRVWPPWRENSQTLPSESCRLSALHGLNHWYLNHGEKVEEAVDHFLATAGDLSPRVREYAALARHGLAQ